MRNEEQLPVFDLRRYLPWLDGKGWRKVLRRGLERLLGLPRVWEMTKQLGNRVEDGEDPFEALLDLSGMKLDGESVRAAMPSAGPVVVVANHPFGGADALALVTLCRRVREDTRILANAELVGFRAMAHAFFPLHILGGERSERRNVAALRDALHHLRGGGLLVLFPGGTVSHWRWKTLRVEDPPWPTHAARVILKADAPALPVRFFGRNPAWFHLVGALHPALRTALIPRAFLAMRGRTVRCASGPLLAVDALPGEAGALTAALRGAVEGVPGGRGTPSP